MYTFSYMKLVTHEIIAEVADGVTMIFLRVESPLWYNKIYFSVYSTWGLTLTKASCLSSTLYVLLRGFQQQFLPC